MIWKLKSRNVESKEYQMKHSMVCLAQLTVYDVANGHWKSIPVFLVGNRKSTKNETSGDSVLASGMHSVASVRLHICAVTYMTKISLHVTLNNQ